MAGNKRQKRPPALSMEQENNRLISKAMTLAERQIEDGTASAQVITHYLKLGTARAQLEERELEAKLRLADAKIEQLESGQRMEELYGRAIDAMRGYSGQEVPAEDEYYNEGY